MGGIKQQLIKWQPEEHIESTNRCKEAMRALRMENPPASSSHHIQDSSLSNGWASAEGAKLQAQRAKPKQTNREPSAEGACVHQRQGLARCGYQQPSAANTQDSQMHPWFHINVASIRNIGDQQVDCRRGSAHNQCGTHAQPEEYRHIKRCKQASQHKKSSGQVQRELKTTSRATAQ